MCLSDLLSKTDTLCVGCNHPAYRGMWLLYANGPGEFEKSYEFAEKCCIFNLVLPERRVGVPYARAAS